MTFLSLQSPPAPVEASAPHERDDPLSQSVEASDGRGRDDTLSLPSDLSLPADPREGKNGIELFSPSSLERFKEDRRNENARKEDDILKEHFNEQTAAISRSAFEEAILQLRGTEIEDLVSPLRKSGDKNERGF
uniref:Uncharacterized protein n=2 Tax=Lotharella globosa TaxID=91324 RepID=A0A7S3YZR4_9EUKA